MPLLSIPPSSLLSLMSSPSKYTVEGGRLYLAEALFHSFRKIAVLRMSLSSCIAITTTITTYTPPYPIPLLDPARTGIREIPSIKLYYGTPCIQVLS